MSDPQLPNEWELGSGLKENYEFVIDHSYFGTDAQYQDGKQLLLIWEGHDAADNSPAREQYSIGKGWSTPDFGRTITGMKNINKNSMYGKIVEWSIEEHKAGRPALLATLLQRGNPMKSDIWEGMKFYMREREIKFGKNLDPVNRVMPVEYLGIDEESTPGQSAVTPAPAAPAPAAPTPSKPASNGASVPGGTATTKILTRLAQKSLDFESFVSEALDIPEVVDNVELRNLVSDDSDSGFYATHQV
jgi:hypothetical protein